MDRQRALQGRTRERMDERARWAARTRVCHRWLALPILGALLLTPVLAFLNVSAAGSFASPAFQQQWNAGEAVAPNFWGPLELARNGQQEPYAEAAGGMRTVQYFDKARMELGGNNTVTNGLLATELITGNRQLGDTLFQNFGPANIPVAGDPDNLGPTYAAIQTNAAQLRVVVSSTPGAAVTVALTPAGALTTFANGATFPQANIGGYDGVTQHNVPTAFVNYRNTAGIPAIGLAISEPFWSNVKVAGQPRDVLIQAFERRVLTYTPANPAAFQVEFGNIGSHYYTWRYVTNTGAGSTTAPTIPTTAPTGTPTTIATTTATATATTTPTVTATATTTPVAPVLSGVSLSNITSARVTTAYTTNVAACGTTEVRVKGDTAWTSNIDGLTCTPGMSFTVTLTSLAPNTQYEVRGAARVGNGPIGYSAIGTFSTLPAQPTADSYEGTWINDDANTTGVVRLVIDATGNSVKITVYDKCGTPSGCLAVSGTTTFTADPLTGTFAAGLISNDKLTINFTDDTRTHLRLVEVRTTILGPVTTNTYTFHRRPFILPPVVSPITTAPILIGP